MKFIKINFPESANHIEEIVAEIKKRKHVVQHVMHQAINLQQNLRSDSYNENVDIIEW